ncbi:MAG: bifunctional phosphopantothenoylcysteine decarboxylase/phosphopantothenate--cysteine ligase CoaBC [Pseudomonadota bacterium]
MTSPLKGKNILLIVTGSIAAYKCADIVRRAQEKGADVRCVMTKSAQQFVTPLLMASLSRHEVHTDMWSLKDETGMGHIRLSREADLILVAPASANIIAKLAHGICDDLASTVLVAADKPVVVAPAMNPAMWLNPATQANVNILRQRGIGVLMPVRGDVACGEAGIGRMMDVADILDALEAKFRFQKSLSGRRAVVTAGPTYEALDPVRFIGNFSSGKQGYAIAGALAGAGAETILVTGPSHEIPPAGVRVVRVVSAEEMLAATMAALAATMAALPADIVVCAAAVADWRPETAARDKIKKTGGKPQITLVENRDILKTVATLPGKRRPKLVIGFAAETKNLKEAARKKLQEKKCDWILANDVSPETGAFGGNFNTVRLLRAQKETSWPRMSKQDVAARLVEEIVGEMKKS